MRPDVRGRGLVQMLMQPRVLLLLLIVVVVVIVLIVGVSSCVNQKSEPATSNIEETKPKNEQDSRVAAGVSASMTSKFTEALDQAELLEKIAENADQYDDDRLLTLALTEPSSIPFVEAYPSSDKSSRPYNDVVNRGEVPSLYNWDERWGAVTYGDGPLAITGSGPTTLAMAYMGLTGKTDYTPTEIAQQASKSNYIGNDSGTKGELFNKLAGTMGLTAATADVSSDTLLYSLGENTVFAVELKADTLTDSAHWALVVNINEDGSVTVFDPTSTAVSSRPWDMNTIASSSTSFYSISTSESTSSSSSKDSGSSSSSSSQSSSSESESSSSTDEELDESSEY